MTIRPRSLSAKLLKRRKPIPANEQERPPVPVLPIAKTLLPAVELDTSLDLSFIPNSSITPQASRTSRQYLSKTHDPFRSRPHRRSRSFSELTSFLSCGQSSSCLSPSPSLRPPRDFDRVDTASGALALSQGLNQPWRSREAWTALHTPPATPGSAGATAVHGSVLERGYGWAEEPLPAKATVNPTASLTRRRPTDPTPSSAKSVCTVEAHPLKPKPPPIPPRSTSRIPHVPLTPRSSSPDTPRRTAYTNSVFYQESDHCVPESARRGCSGYSTNTAGSSSETEGATTESELITDPEENDQRCVILDDYTMPRTPLNDPSYLSPPSRAHTPILNPLPNLDMHHRLGNYNSFAISRLQSDNDISHPKEILDLPPLLPSIAKRTLSPSPSFTSTHNAAPIPWAQQSPEKALGASHTSSLSASASVRVRKLRHVPSPLSLRPDNQSNAYTVRKGGSEEGHGNLVPLDELPRIRTRPHTRQRSMTAPSVFATAEQTPSSSPSSSATFKASAMSIATIPAHRRPPPDRPLPPAPAPQTPLPGKFEETSPRPPASRHRTPVADLRKFSPHSDARARMIGTQGEEWVHVSGERAVSARSVGRGGWI